MKNTYSEKDFQQEVRQIARLYGWADYCAYNSRHSPAGWPDLTLLRPPHLIFAELKTDRGRLQPPQKRTIDLLQQCQHIQTFVWRPDDYPQIHAAIRSNDSDAPATPIRHQNHQAFQSAIRKLATAQGWADYCQWDSRRSPAGWPDLILLRPPEIIAAELKIPPDRLSPAQRATLQSLAACQQIHTFVWRPRDSQQIADTLFCPEDSR